MLTSKKWTMALAAVFMAAPMAFAQFYPTAHDARPGAMGGCLFVPEKVRSVTLDYRQGWLLSGLADKSIAVVWPAGIGVVSVDYLHHGNRDYNEQQVSASYRIQATEWLEVGVGARYLFAGSSDILYQPENYLAAEAVVETHWGRQTSAMLYAKHRPWDEIHPFGAHLQFMHRPVNGLLSVVEVEMEQAFRAHAGMEYCYEECYFVRAGFATNPIVATFGVGVKMKSLSIDLSTEVHSVLGISPQTSIRLWF